MIGIDTNILLRLGPVGGQVSPLSSPAMPWPGLAAACGLSVGMSAG
jgi:hypothetical protein